MAELFREIMNFILAILGILSPAVLLFWGFMYWRERRRSAQYKVIWKRASALDPAEIMEIRAREDHGFKAYYFERPEHRQIVQHIREGYHVLVTGNPLAGKTRTAFEAVRSLGRRYDVTVPNLVDVDPNKLEIPRQLKFGRKRILFLDDLDKFFARQNFQFLFNKYLQDGGTVIVATCRSGPEEDILRQKCERELETFRHKVEIPKVRDELAQKVAIEVKQKIPEAFDGNIGSIFIDLDAMRQRYRDLDSAEKAILRSIRRLHDAGIYSGRLIFSIERIQRVCETREDITRKKHEWYDHLDTLATQGFVESKKEGLQVEEAYLERVVEDIGDTLENLREMHKVFSGDGDALFNIGDRSYGIGSIDLQKKNFMKVAAAAHIETLKVYTLDAFPIQYSMTQNNLGNVYSTLAEVEDKAANCRWAIEAYTEALKIRTLVAFPMNYGVTQNNLGSAYSTLAEVADKAANCRRAIGACTEALKVYTRDAFPMQYGGTQNNLGNALLRLAEVEDKAANCRRAIAAYAEALKVYTRDAFPIQYGNVQNSLGAAYQTLAEVEDKAANCRRAIGAYTEALKVRTLDAFPMDYGMTQNNLGNAYWTLAEMEDKAANCRRAARAYIEALKIYPEEEFPEVYKVVIGNLRGLAGFCGEEVVKEALEE